MQVIKYNVDFNYETVNYKIDIQWLYYVESETISSGQCKEFKPLFQCSILYY